MEIELDGFTLSDAETVVGIYVCSQCEGGLKIVPVDWEAGNLYYVICPECGNVEQIGRISKTTVAIRNERGIWDFPIAIRALSDLWGHLIAKKEDRKAILNQLGF